jgi:Protein phosphatase 2C
MLPNETPTVAAPPSSVLLQTHVSTPWVVTLFSQKGEAHIVRGDPCQDACGIAQVGEALILALADGVGSCPRSHEGAQAAIHTILHSLCAQIAAGPVTTGSLIDAIEAARTTLHQLAGTARTSPFDFACTVAVAVITPEAAFGANLGDSSILMLSDRDDPDDPLAISPLCSSPVNLNNEVDTLLHADWRDAVASHVTPAQYVRALILATDGANAFFSDPAAAGDSADTFDNLFIKALPEVFRTNPPHKLSSYFAHYLLTNGAIDDDDRTLILAYRSPEPNPERPGITPPAEADLVQAS